MPEKSPKYNTALNMASGALAGVAARTASAPIDLLKIRFQLQKRSSPQYESIISAFKTVFKQEGIRGFWKGNSAGIYLYATYSAFQFGIYEKLCQSLETKDALRRGSMGAIAALGGTLISYPFDLIRTRHSLQKCQSLHYKNVIQTAQTIIREEGVNGLYKGIGPSLAQVVPYMGLVFASFTFTKEHLKGQAWPTGEYCDFIAGAVSGLISKFVLMPVDVIRKRLQIQGSSYQIYIVRDLPVYKGMYDAVRSIAKTEGVAGFFNGLSFALLKSVPATTTTFVVYGILKRLSNQKENPEQMNNK